MLSITVKYIALKCIYARIVTWVRPLNAVKCFFEGLPLLEERLHFVLLGLRKEMLLVLGMISEFQNL